MATEVQIALQPQAGQDPAAALATAAAKLARSTLATLIQQAGQPMTGKIVPPPANLPSGFAQVAVADQLLTLKLSTPLPAGTSVRIDVQPAPNGQPAVTVQPLPQPTAAQPAPAPLPAQTQLPLPQASPPPSASTGPAPQQAPQAPPAPVTSPTATTTSSAPTAPTPATAPAPQAAASAAMPRPTPAPQPVPSAPQITASLQPPPAASPTPAPNAAAPTLSQPGAPTPPVTTTAAPPPPPVAPAPNTSAPTPAPQPPQAQQTSPSIQRTPAPTVQAAVSSAQTPAPVAPKPQIAVSAPPTAPSSPPSRPPTPQPSPAPAATSQPAAPATTQPAQPPAAPPAAPPQALMQRLTQAFAPPPPATTTPAPAAGSPAQMAMVATTQAAAQQQSAAPLMQALAVALPALPKEVADAAGKVLATRVVLDRGAPSGETLKQAVLSSGVFVDTPKSAGQPDIRQALTQLRGTLLSWLGDDIAPVAALTRRPPPPARGAVPRAQSAELPQPSVETAAKEAGKALLSQTDGALSRLKLMQLTSQPADAARPGVAPQAAPAEWNLEVPMLLGRELTMAQIQIQRDGKGKAEARDRHWRLRFALKFSVIGEVGAQVTMTGTRAAVAIWADEPHTAETLEAMLPELGPALAAKGLDLTSLVVRRGAPRDEAQPVGRLMDSTR